MDFSLKFKKVLAGASVAALSLTQVGTVLAAYNDVPAGVWYGDAVNAFVDAGYLDATQARFRGGRVSRAEESDEWVEQPRCEQCGAVITGSLVNWPVNCNCRKITSYNHDFGYGEIHYI